MPGPAGLGVLRSSDIEGGVARHFALPLDKNETYHLLPADPARCGAFQPVLYGLAMLMKNTSWTTWVVACAAAAWAFLPSVSAAQAAQNTLRVRLNADIRTTDPGVNRDVNTDAVVAHLLEGLVAFREDMSIGPLLAQSIDVSADGRTYTFKLRPGLRFSNGAPLTAADVVFAWDRDMKPETGWRCQPEFNGSGLIKVLKVEARDPLTVVYMLEKPAALFLAALARSDCGGTGIYHRSSLDADGKWREAVGSGPFKIGEWKRGQYIELLRNEHYAALPGKPDGNTGNKSTGLAKVRFVIVPDPSAAKAALMSGSIDLIADAAYEDAAELKARKDLKVTFTPSMDMNGVLMQTRDPLLQDVRIRRALALALDLPGIVDVTTGDESKPSRSPIPMASPFFGKAQAQLPQRNVAAAKKLLAEAGYRGQPIKMLTTKRYTNVFTIAMLTQAMAQEIGLNVKIEVLDWATLLDRYTRGNFQMLAFTYSSRLDPSLSYDMFTGPAEKERRKVWTTPEAVALVRQSMQETEKDKRQAVFDKLDAKLREDVPVVFMYSQVRLNAARNNVKGYAGWPLGQPRAWGVSFNGANGQ